jgi:hypothetical protein
MSPDKARACIGVVWEMAGDVRQCDWRDSWEATPKSPGPVQVNDAPSTFSILPITTLDRISSTLARVPGTCMNDQVDSLAPARLTLTGCLRQSPPHVPTCRWCHC